MPVVEEGTLLEPVPGIVLPEVVETSEVGVLEGTLLDSLPEGVLPVEPGDVDELLL